MPTDERIAKLTGVVSRRQTGTVVLEDISDPHNAEAVFRTCEAFGIQRVCLVFDKTKAFNPLQVGKATSSAANKWLDYSTYNSIDECAADLHGQGYTLLATVLGPDATSIYDAGFESRQLPALMLGNERRGLSERAVELADELLTIPMRGITQSLNLSVSAAIFLFELTRQRISTGNNDFYLTIDKQNAMLESLLNR